MHATINMTRPLTINPWSGRLAACPVFTERLYEHALRAEKEKKFCRAVFHGHEATVRWMLFEGVSPNSSAVLVYGIPLPRLSALEIAVLAHNVEMMNLLLSYGADPMHNKYDGSRLVVTFSHHVYAPLARGNAQPQAGFNGLLNLLEVTAPKDTPEHDATRMWLEIARCKRNWRIFRRGYKMRCICMYWIGVTAEAMCAEGGVGRQRDEEAFVKEFEGLRLAGSGVSWCA